jgi:hypothetical protein
MADGSEEVQARRQVLQRVMDEIRREMDDMSASSERLIRRHHVKQAGYMKGPIDRYTKAASPYQKGFLPPTS